MDVKAVSRIESDKAYFSDGLINHWVPNHEALVPVHRLRQNSQYEMVDSGSSIKIRQNGIYLIYAQVRPLC